MRLLSGNPQRSFDADPRLRKYLETGHYERPNEPFTRQCIVKQGYDDIVQATIGLVDHVSGP